MARFVSFWRHVALLVARLGLGGILILHGATRYQAGIPSQVAYLEQFSTPYPEVAAYAATTFEIVGGIFLILGALTPLIGLGVLVQQVLTILWTSYYKSWNLLNADGTYNGGFEYSVALGLLGLLFLVRPIHMYAQLRGAYALGTFSALWRTTVLLVSSMITLGMFAAMIVVLGLAD